MLTALRIKNLALVEDLSLEWQPGYNVVTGETGAGKSILIGALNLVLGERADRAQIRSGAESCCVEAVFDIGGLEPRVRAFLDENGLDPCEDKQLFLKRTLTTAGANRQFINGSPTTLNTLSKLGEWLVDIHGPHEHQSLLNTGRQLAILDAFGGLDAEREAFGNLLRRRAELEASKTQLVVDERTYAQQVDLLRYQVNEITAARLEPEEEEQTEQEYRRVSNAARLLQLSQAALDLLSENEASLLTQAGIVGRTLQELERIDPSAASLRLLHEQSVSALRDLQGELSRYIDKTEVNPGRLQELEERLNLIHSLKRKYGASVGEVIRFGQEAAAKLSSLESRDAELARIHSEMLRLDEEAWRTGRALSAKRRKLIPQLSRAVAKQLSDLGFRQSKFDISVQSLAQDQDPDTTLRGAAATPGWTFQGLDTIEFLFAPNPGEPARPLRTIASSGELARVMLALKTVLAAVDQVPVLVFDEVDANIGGETGHTVGEKMVQIAKSRQVLCITHLPQVAAPAAAHFVVVKQVRGGRTVSEIEHLRGEQRLTELARMLGGQSEAARKHARELLDL